MRHGQERTDQKRTITRRASIALLGAGLVLAGGVTPAGAAPQGFEQVDQGAGRFYANFADDVLLFTGPGAEAICLGEPEPLVPGRVFHRQDGGMDIKVNARDVQITLYRSSLGAPEFIDQTCEALFDDDDSTEPVPPFAHGMASFKERTSVPASGGPGGVQIFNGVNGKATATDGTTWKVRTWADFQLGADGMPIGDPADFQGLSIHQIRR